MSTIAQLNPYYTTIDMTTVTDLAEITRALWWIKAVQIACRIFAEGELALTYIGQSPLFPPREWHLSLCTEGREVVKGCGLIDMIHSALEIDDLPDNFRAKCMAVTELL